jgi:hypothetical protein
MLQVGSGRFGQMSLKVHGINFQKVSKKENLTQLPFRPQFPVI